MKKPVIASISNRRTCTASGLTALVSHPNPLNIHHATTIGNSPLRRPSHPGWVSTAWVTWVTTKTNTKSKKSSVGVTRPWVLSDIHSRLGMREVSFRTVFLMGGSLPSTSHRALSRGVDTRSCRYAASVRVTDCCS